MAVEGEEASELPGAAGMVGRVARLFLAALVLMVVLSILWFLSGVLGSFVLRVAVGIVLTLAAASLGISYFRQVANPPPPDPEPTEVHPRFRLAYVCDMCGLELAVLKVAKDRAPKHCGEQMLLVRLPAPGDPDPGQA